MTFKDYFSDVAENYRDARPTYPPALFKYLASLVPEKKLAWDCATGNGQSVIALSGYFEQVIATDASDEQIKYAQPALNVQYKVEPAEHSSLKAHSVDLVTVAQAVHWFNFDKFYAEVKRVLKPNGIIALWAYPLLKVEDAALQKEITKFYFELNDFWPKERVHCDTDYRDIPFPFTQINTPTFKMAVDWNLTELLSYLATWSGVARYKKTEHCDPIEKILKPKLLALWEEPMKRRCFSTNLILKVGK